MGFTSGRGELGVGLRRVIERYALPLAKGKKIEQKSSWKELVGDIRVRLAYSLGFPAPFGKPISP